MPYIFIVDADSYRILVRRRHQTTAQVLSISALGQGQPVLPVIRLSPRLCSRPCVPRFLALLAVQVQDKCGEALIPGLKCSVTAQAGVSARRGHSSCCKAEGQRQRCIKGGCTERGQQHAFFFPRPVRYVLSMPPFCSPLCMTIQPVAFFFFHLHARKNYQCI